MSEKKILLAEDDASTGVMLFEFLKSKNYSVEIAKDGVEALNKYQRNPSQIVITDIEMSNMDGNELINHLNAFEIPPVIFVTTSHKKPELIIEIMKKGVYDYFVKPVDLNDISLKLTRAFETYDMKRAFEISQKEKIIRLENNLEWYKFEESFQHKDFKTMGAEIFESLLTSFNQGSGFGSLVTFMSIMKSTAIKEGNFYKIDDKLFETIMENASSAEKALQIFADITKIVSDKQKTEKISLSNLHNDISATIQNLNSQIAARNHHLHLSDKKSFFDNIYLDINHDYFIKAIEEIIINALKFSPEGSDVMILFHKEAETFTISFINDIILTENGQKGIPVGYENMVFEPFYRLTKTVHEIYKTLDYGLGLTLVEKIITKNGGKVTIKNITDYSDIKTGPKTKVECSITISKIFDNIEKS